MQVSSNTMEFNNAVQRGGTQWITGHHGEVFDAQRSYSNSPIVSLPPPTRPNTTDNTMTTPVDPLGIKCWPSAIRPMSRPPMPRPKTFNEGAYSTTYSPNYPNPSSWNTYDVRLPSQYHMPPPATSASNDYLHFHSIDGSLADQKPAEESLDFASLDSDLNQFTNDITQQDENAPIINLRKPSVTEHEPLSLDTSFSRRLSGSSFSMSSTAPTDLPELSAYSEVPPYASASASDYTPRSSLNLSATPLSPIPSPRYAQQDTTRHPQQDTIRSESRSRASPSPRPSMRTAPYSLDSNRNKRWSTGSYAAASPARRTSPFIYTPEGYFPQVPNFLRHSSPVVPTPTSTPTNPLLPSANLSKTPLMGSNPPPRFHRSSVLLPSSMFDSNPPPHPLPSTHGAPHLFRTLQSNASPHDHHLTHYTEDLSDPPDLFGPLSSPPSSPPSSDMSPPSPSLAAHEQDLRFPTDLYTPKYVRGHGNKREGWCGICKPGRWLVLKNSAFWYDKSFTHGVSAATGQAFESPRETRRMEGNSDVWEGLCGSCGEWVALVSSKKKGTTWFRHAYKCHTHPKVKDAPKRRRGSSHVRPSTANSTGGKSAKTEKTEPVTPALSNASPAVDGIGSVSGMKTESPLHSLAKMI